MKTRKDYERWLKELRLKRERKKKELEGLNEAIMKIEKRLYD